MSQAGAEAPAEQQDEARGGNPCRGVAGLADRRLFQPLFGIVAADKLNFYAVCH
jgi:hypothetical protein